MSQTKMVCPTCRTPMVAARVLYGREVFATCPRCSPPLPIRSIADTKHEDHVLSHELARQRMRHEERMREMTIAGVFAAIAIVLALAIALAACGGAEPESRDTPDAGETTHDAGGFAVLDASAPEPLFCSALAQEPVLLLVVTDEPITRIEIEAYGDRACSPWCLRAASSSAVGVRGSAYPVAAPIGESYLVRIFDGQEERASACAVPFENGAIEL